MNCFNRQIVYVANINFALFFIYETKFDFWHILILSSEGKYLL